MRLRTIHGQFQRPSATAGVPLTSSTARRGRWRTPRSSLSLTGEERPWKQRRMLSMTEAEEGLTSKMLTACKRKVVLLAPLLLMMGLISARAATAEEESGAAIPAESRPCVDCHAFEFMQRALQDLKKTAYNLDSRTETLLFKVEKRTLCDCLATNALN